MSWSDRVDRAFARRREELLGELVAGGADLVDECVAVAGACAKDHPLAWVGSGVAAGACLGAAGGRPSGAGDGAVPRQRSHLLRAALAMARLGAFVGHVGG